MHLEAERCAALVSALANEYEAIEDNWKLNEEAWARIEAGAEHVLDWSALGYTLHTVYTGMENYFLRVAKAFENDVPPESWHRELLHRMSLAIPGVRPALFTKEQVRLIDQLRSFRHVFRHLYDDRLDPERLRLLQSRVPAMREAFRNAHDGFIDAIATAAGDEN